VFCNKNIKYFLTGYYVKLCPGSSVHLGFPNYTTMAEFVKHNTRNIPTRFSVRGFQKKTKI
jgi:hypothetical protein